MSKHRAVTEFDEILAEIKTEAKKPRIIICTIILVPLLTFTFMYAFALLSAPINTNW